MMCAELEGIVCSGPRRGKQFTYALLDERVRSAKSLHRDKGLAELTRRCFLSRGPATVQDFARWSGLTVADARTGLEGIKAKLEHEVVDGRTYWFAASNAAAAMPSSPIAHLLSIYDEYVSGYKDRSAIINAANGARLSAMGNALAYIVVVRGQIVGTWKRAFDHGTVSIELEMFVRLTRAEAQAVRAAVDSYARFVEMKLRL